VRVEAAEPAYDYLANDVFIVKEYSLLQRRSGAGAGPSLETRLEATATARKDGSAAVGVDWSIASTAEISAAVRAKAITAGDCDALSKSGIRSALGALALPTSGKLETMRERLREVLLGEGADRWDF